MSEKIFDRDGEDSLDYDPIETAGDYDPVAAAKEDCQAIAKVLTGLPDDPEFKREVRTYARARLRGLEKSRITEAASEYQRVLDNPQGYLDQLLPELGEQ